MPSDDAALFKPENTARNGYISAADVEAMYNGDDPSWMRRADAARVARIEAIAGDLEDRDAARALVATRRAEAAAASDPRVRKMTGDTFALDLPEDIPSIVGAGSNVLAIEGEAALFVGGDGVGKSSLVQQLCLARIGLRKDFLSFPVQRAPGRALYLAMDRPGQIRRSFARMVSESDRAALAERLVAWFGPLPIDPLTSPAALADWIGDEFGDDIADVYVDSYKDMAPGLAEDKPGAQLNLAMQEVLARGMQWFGIHHQRKPASDRTADYNLSDVYGSRWLTAGAGSVFMVLGDAGDETVELRHVKQPLGVVGPLLVQHNHATGRSGRVSEKVDVLTALKQAEADDMARMTVREIATAVYGQYDERLRKRVDRELKRLHDDVGSGVHMEPGSKGGSAGSTPARWWFAPVEAPAKHRLNGGDAS